MTTDATTGPDLLLSDLKQRLADRRTVVIVGAGVSISATEGNSLAGWRGLLENGVSRCEGVVTTLPADWGSHVRRELQSDDMDDLLGAAQKIEKKLRKSGEFAKWLIDTVGALALRDRSVIDAILDLKTPLLTTNYDGLIEKASGLPSVTWKEPNKYERAIQADRAGVLHLHGFYDDPDSVVLGITSYDAVLRDRFAQEMQHAIRALHTLVFVGCGMGLEDPNFSAWLEWARPIFAGSTYRHYRLALSSEVNAIQQEHHPDDRIFVIPYGNTHSDLPAFLRSLASSAALRTPHTLIEQPSPSLPTLPLSPSLPPASELKEYISAVKAAHGRIRFVEIPKYDDTPDAPIDRLYVPPHICRSQIAPDRTESDWPATHTLDTILSEESRIVILGDPGYGKSTLTSSLAWQLCNDQSGVPLPMIVRDLHLKADITWEGLLKAFLTHGIGRYIGTLDTLKAILKSGDAVIFLDGLDEIASVLVRKRLRDAVHAGFAEFPNCRWILTSRIVGYDDVPFHLASPKPGSSRRKSTRRSTQPKDSSIACVCYLAPFSAAQIAEFADKWYGQHELDKSTASARSATFVSAINKNTGTKRLGAFRIFLR